MYSESESPWEYNEEMEAVLKEIPLRKVSSKPFKGYI